MHRNVSGNRLNICTWPCSHVKGGNQVCDPSQILQATNIFLTCTPMISSWWRSIFSPFPAASCSPFLYHVTSGSGTPWASHLRVTEEPTWGVTESDSSWVFRLGGTVYTHTEDMISVEFTLNWRDTLLNFLWSQLAWRKHILCLNNLVRFHHLYMHK